ncbi:MAG: hypothetical protein IPJ87_03725 [Flavobacteriales bacterium]|nr:hypothetical protein [Flavobacteriales bacterium]MBK9701601.1 hypothetical protein [Flavobacteriales bacterium]
MLGVRIAMFDLALLTSGAWGQSPFGADPGFVPTLDPNAVDVRSCYELPDGHLLISHSTTSGLVPFQSRILRLLPDGSVDSSFDPIMGEYAILPYDEGRFYTQSGGSGGIIRRRSTADGSLDTTFNFDPNPWQTWEVMAIGDIEVLDDGRLLLTGWIELSDTAHGWIGEYDLIRVTTSGSLDTTFTPRRANGFMHDIHIMPDQWHLISGAQSVYDFSQVKPTFRISPVGNVDATFTVGHIYLGKGPYNIIQQSGGKYLVAGRLFYYKNLLDIDTLELVRWNNDGSLDSSFNNWNEVVHSTSSAYSSGYDLEVLTDGRILFTGLFDHINNEERGGVAMFDQNGELLPDPFEEGGCGAAGLTTAVGLYTSENEGRFLHGTFSGFADDVGLHPLRHLVRLNAADVFTPEHPSGSMAAFPMPCRTDLFLQLPKSSPSFSARASVSDRLGRVQLQRLLQVDHGEATIDLSDLPAGWYVLVLEGDSVSRFSTSVVKVP